MCNGICIPKVIPCNSKCLDGITFSYDTPTLDTHRTAFSYEKAEKLFGPITCSMIPLEYPIYDIHKPLNRTSTKLTHSNNDYFWTGSVDEEMLPKLINLLGIAY